MTDHILHPRTYYLIFGGLLVLTLLTVGASFIDLGRLHLLVALAIAGTKAALVVLFFMHVLYSTRLTWVVVGAALFWLLILFSLTFSDYLTRDWLGAPTTWP